MIGRSEVIPFRQMTDFNAYVWLHYYATRDTLLDETTNCTSTGEHGGFCNIKDFAHEGPGFPTWHRAYLLIAERMLQEISGNSSLTIPYWDWTDEEECGVCTNEFVGETDKITGEIDSNSRFSDWEMISWDDEEHYKHNHIYDGENEGKVKRFPGTNPDYPKLPTKSDVEKALKLNEYDTWPFNRSSRRCFRNALEGFLNLDTYEPVKNNERHPLHNHVHMFFGTNATMSKVPPSANDPVFLLHHCFIDKLFERWIRRHSHPLPPFPKKNAGIGHNFDESMVPFFPVIKHRDVYKPSIELGYNYDKKVSGSCDRSPSLGRRLVFMWIIFLMLN